MGCGMSTEEREGKARNEEIENQLKRDRMQQRNEIKMLLLGTSSTWPGGRPAPRARPRLYRAGAETGKKRAPLLTLAQVLVNPASRQS